MASNDNIEPESWKKKLIHSSSDEGSKDDEKIDDNTNWEDTCEKVFHKDQFDMENLKPVDEAQVDARALSYRRPSLHTDPVPAPKPAKLPEDPNSSRMRRVRTSVPHMSSSPYMDMPHSPGRLLMKKISEDPSDHKDTKNPNLRVSTDSESDDDESPSGKRKSSNGARKPSQHAFEMPQKKKSYYTSRPSHGDADKSPLQYINEGIVMDEDLASIASHRNDPHPAVHSARRSRAASFTPGMAQEIRKVSASSTKSKKVLDRTPKNLFIEMDVLKNGEWEEQARWIKFEEDLLEGACRWGNPHVSSLTFHSLINVRLVLEKCVFHLDMDVSDYHSFVYHIVEEFGIHDDLTENVKMEVFRNLLLSHKYVDGNNSNFNLGGIRRRLSRSSTQASLRRIPEALAEVKRNSSFNLLDKNQPNKLVPDVEGGFPSPPSFSDLQKLAAANRGDSIMNKIEEGSEGTMALVGCIKSLEKPLVAFARLSPAVVMPNLMEIPLPVRFIFILFTPELSPNMDYHEVGRSFCTLMSNKDFQTMCYRMDDRQEMLNSINHFLDETVVLPPGDWDKKNLLSMNEIKELKQKKRLRKEAMEKLKKAKEKKKSSGKKPEMEKVEKEDKETKDDDPLKRTNVPFGGIIKEIGQRYPKYLSDITDSFSVVCVAAIIFIFFAALAGAIAFGGLWGEKTDGLIGLTETLITSAVGGCIFALLSCQPLAIIGVTGPLMVFDEALYKFSKTAEVEYLTWRAWIGLWLIVIALVVAAFQGSFVVKYFTTFTKDIFASFIATIYIGEAIHSTLETFHHHPPITLQNYCEIYENSTHHENLVLHDDFHNNSTMHFDNETMAGHNVRHNEPNTAFKSFILQYCAFWIAYFLKCFRNHKALGRTIRRCLGDFGVPIAIAVMVGIDQAFPSVYTDKLIVPEGLEVTSPLKREWFISPMGQRESVPIWVPFVSVLPAILLYLILFMETTICELILMDKAKKGCGLHWDIVLLCFINAAAGLFGGPWLCVATVRAMSHLSALTVMSTTHAPGESPKVAEIKDQRVTAFFVYLMIGLSILANSALKLIPSSVIFGIFFYMGVYSLHGMEFYDRLCLALMPVKYHPHVHYVRKVRTWKMHLFTAFQGLGLATLWIVKSTAAALAFPFFVVGMVPLRLCLQFIFTKKELDALDGPNSAKVFTEEEDEPDFLAHGIGA